MGQEKNDFFKFGMNFVFFLNKLEQTCPEIWKKNRFFETKMIQIFEKTVIS